MKPLPPKCKAIAEYRIQNPTLNQHEIAKALNVTPGRISQVLNSAQVRKHYPLLARRRLEDTAVAKAAKAYEELIDQTQNLQVREKASHVILKEFGVFEAPDVRIEGEITLRSVRELEQIVQRVSGTPQDAIEAEIVEPQDPSV
jgi:transcriptional regulator with XRE-family HTH domain